VISQTYRCTSAVSSYLHASLLSLQSANEQGIGVLLWRETLPLSDAAEWSAHMRRQASGGTFLYTRGREPMAREPNMALLVTAYGSQTILSWKKNKNLRPPPCNFLYRARLQQK